MFLVINDYLKIVLVFLSVIALFCLFMFMLYMTKRLIDKKKKNDDSFNNKTSRKAKIYSLIYDKNNLSFNDLKFVFDVSDEILLNDLQELINDEAIIEFEIDNIKYYKIRGN